MLEAERDIMFHIIPVFIGFIFVFIIGAIIFGLMKNTSTWMKNNQQPILTTQAKVVGKRTSIYGGGESIAYNHYHVTFEVPSGDRIEYQIEGPEYGNLIEGDIGELKFQGTRYLGFIRN